jgi:hypothetical protein
MPRFVFYHKKRLLFTKKRFFIIKNQNAHPCSLRALVIYAKRAFRIRLAGAPLIRAELSAITNHSSSSKATRHSGSVAKKNADNALRRDQLRIVEREIKHLRYGGSSATDQWSLLSIQAQARGKSLPELQKACGLIGPLVIIEERRALGVKISRIACGNNYIEYKLSD